MSAEQSDRGSLVLGLALRALCRGLFEVASPKDRTADAPLQLLEQGSRASEIRCTFQELIKVKHQRAGSASLSERPCALSAFRPADLFTGDFHHESPAAGRTSGPPPPSGFPPSKPRPAPFSSVRKGFFVTAKSVAVAPPRHHPSELQGPLFAAATRRTLVIVPPIVRQLHVL